MIDRAIQKLASRQDLAITEMRQAMSAIMSGECTEVQIAAFLIALHMKGETVDELVGAAQVMREHVTLIRCDVGGLLDTCGTGGDMLSTFNISTAAALVAAACGVPVAKHGNRSMTSPSGSAEVLQELGVRIDVAVPVVEACLRQIGIGFCYAPLLHSSMRHAAAVRHQLPIRTVFNLLGPLTNPASAHYQLLGVSRRDLAYKIGAVLSRLGTRHAFVVSGHEGLDEVTLTGPTFVMEVLEGTVEQFTWHPSDFGLSSCRLQDLQIRSATESAERIREVLAGRPGPCRDIVAANTAAALLCCKTVDDLPMGVRVACDCIDSGKARALLERLVQFTAGQDEPATWGSA